MKKILYRIIQPKNIVDLFRVLSISALSCAIFFVPFNSFWVKFCVYFALGAILIVKYLEFRVGKRPLFSSNCLNKPVLFFLLTMLIATVFSYDFYESQKVFFERIVFYALVFFTVKEAVISKKAVYLILGVITLVSFVVGLDVLWQYFKGYDLFFNFPKTTPEWLSEAIGLTGPFGKHNLLSGFVELVTPLVFFLCLKRKKLYLTIFTWITLLLLIFSWVFTFQRTPWLGIVTSVFLIFFLLKKRYALVFSATTILVSAFLVPREVLFRLQKTFEAGGDTGRFRIWSEAIRIFTERPLLGSGLGAFGRKARINLLHAENTYLELLTDAGILGLLGFLFILITIIIKSVRFIKDKDIIIDRKFITAALFAACSSYFIVGLFSTNMIVGIGFSVLFWTILALNSVMFRLAKN